MATTVAPSEIWISRGRGVVGDGVGFTVRVLGTEDAKATVNRNGAAAVIVKATQKPGKAMVFDEEIIAYLTLNEVQRLAKVMEPLKGTSDEPLPPPISGPERESWKTQEGPGG